MFATPSRARSVKYDIDRSPDSDSPIPHDNHCSQTVLGPNESRLVDSITPNRRLDSTSLRDRDDASWWIRPRRTHPLASSGLPVVGVTSHTIKWNQSDPTGTKEHRIRRGRWRGRFRRSHAAGSAGRKPCRSTRRSCRATTGVLASLVGRVERARSLVERLRPTP